MNRKPLLLFVAVALMPVPAHAEEPYYFHKSGVSRDAYMADVERCAQLSGGVRTDRYQVLATNPSAPYAMESAAIATFFIGFMKRAERRRMQSRVERTCMADKGYQRREIEKPVYTEIKLLDGEARLNRLFSLVSVSEPTGKVLVE